MHDDKGFDKAGDDSQRPADNAGVHAFNAFDPFVAPDPEPPAETQADEPAPASMSMTKAELLERLHEHEDGLTKAQILERIKRFEGGDGAEGDAPDPTPAAAPMAADMPAPETCQVTLNGETYTWTKDTEDTVPEEARLIWARSKGVNV